MCLGRQELRAGKGAGTARGGSASSEAVSEYGGSLQTKCVQLGKLERIVGSLKIREDYKALIYVFFYVNLRFKTTISFDKFDCVLKSQLHPTLFFHTQKG